MVFSKNCRNRSTEKWEQYKIVIVFNSEKRSKNEVAPKTQAGWKMNLDAPILGKFINQSWKMMKEQSYIVKVRRDNSLEGLSAVISRRNLACRGKYFLVGSASALYVYAKEKILSYIGEGKNVVTTFPQILRHDLPFDCHNIDFSPLDDSTFCVAGLHGVAVFSITP